MWGLDFEKLKACLPKGKSLGTLAIESGTCRGNGTRALAKEFSRVITLELSEELHQFARARLSGEGFTNVTFLHGDSPKLLGPLLQTLPNAERLFLFLDAHWSGDASVDWSQSSWKGYGVDTAHRGKTTPPDSASQCPLDEELKAIFQCWKGEAVILIEDTKNIPAQGPGRKNQAFLGEDWSHLTRESLLSLLGGRIKGFHELSHPCQWLIELGPADA